MNVTVIGGGSFIAQALRRHCTADAGWRFLGHGQALADTGWTQHSDIVVNCAFDDRLKDEDYRPEWDIDLSLARLVAMQPGVRYVMLSSRTVYGPRAALGRLHEKLCTAPQSRYAIAKRNTEQSLSVLLGERLTIFRLGNIFGSELMPGRRNFFAQALRSLRDRDHISLDISPFVERDFLPVDHCAAWLSDVTHKLRGGVFQLGAGFGTPVGRIAQWIIEGHGGGELRVSNMRELDAFWMDMAHTQETFDTPGVTLDEIRAACHAVGRSLRAARAAALGGVG